MQRRHLLLGLLASKAAHAQPAFDTLTRHIEDELPDVQSVVAHRAGQVRFEFHRAGSGPQTLRDVQSVTKSVLSMAVGVALARREITSLDQPVLPLLPELQDVADGRAMRALSWRHLLGLTAGFDTAAPLTRRQWDDPLAIGSRPFASAPGERFQYDNHSSNLLSIALQRTVGQKTADYTQRHLFAPLGITAFDWATGPQGHSLGALGLQLRTGDLARLGDAMLAEGETPLGAAFRLAATQPQSAGGAPGGLPYGLGWWVVPAREGQRPTFFGLGFGGQYLWVHPPLGLVVAATSVVSGASGGRAQALGLIRGRLFAALTGR
jgi:CubicO group peptidase (beta-lactamase class C family)